MEVSDAQASAARLATLVAAEAPGADVEGTTFAPQRLDKLTVELTALQSKSAALATRGTQMCDEGHYDGDGLRGQLKTLSSAVAAVQTAGEQQRVVLLVALDLRRVPHRI